MKGDSGPVRAESIRPGLRMRIIAINERPVDVEQRAIPNLFASDRNRHVLDPTYMPDGSDAALPCCVREALRISAPLVGWSG
jgi:hypothetical protein